MKARQFLSHLSDRFWTICEVRPEFLPLLILCGFLLLAAIKR